MGGPEFTKAVVDAIHNSLEFKGLTLMMYDSDNEPIEYDMSTINTDEHYAKTGMMITENGKSPGQFLYVLAKMIEDGEILIWLNTNNKRRLEYLEKLITELKN